MTDLPDVDTPDEWTPVPPKFPDHWLKVSFDDVFNVIAITDKKIPQKEYLKTGIWPVIDQGASFVGGYTDDETKIINVDAPLLVFGDHTRCMKFVKSDFAPGADGTKILVVPVQLDPKFYYHLYFAIKLPDRGYSRHFGFLKRCVFPIAPLNEQRRIVEKIEALFDEIDAGIQSLKTARTTLGLYRQSLLKSAFEGRLTADWRAQNADKLEAPKTLLARLEKDRGAWHEREFQRWQDDVAAWENDGSKGPKPRKPEVYKPSGSLTEPERTVLPKLPSGWIYARLNDIAHIGSGMSVSKARKFDDPVDTPYLRVANVQRGHLDLAEIKMMPVEKSQLSALCLRTWDILFNEGGDRDKLGRGWIWEDQVEICITQNHVFRATPFRHDKGWSIFVSQWGNSYGRDYFEAGGKQTTNLASINKTVLKALPVPIPSPAEQAEITRILDARLDAAARLEAEIDAALTRADALRQSILKKAFSGQLVPQDPSDEPAAALLVQIEAEKPKTPRTKKKRTANA